MKSKLKQQPLKMAKSTTTTYKIAAFIFIVTLLIYIHDAIPKDSGRIGLSSARVYFYTVLAEVRYLALWFFVYFLSKGKSWRFIIWLPILLTSYQLIIRIFSLQKTGYNEFDFKMILTTVITLILAVYYFRVKRNEL